MTIEMSAARLMAPHLGSALPVWASLIAWVLVSAATGYVVGGKLSTRPMRRLFPPALLVVSALLVLVLPFAGPPCLRAVAGLLTGKSLLAAAGGAAALAVLLGLPVLLLGAAVPVIIRLLVHEKDEAGKAAGMVQAFSTAGSIAGTLVPAFWSIQAVGTRATFAGFAVVLLLAGLWGLAASMGARALLVLAAAAALLAVRAVPGPDAAAGARLLHVEETLYHTAWVVEREGGLRELKIDDGLTDQSASRGGEPAMFGSWPQLAMAALIGSGKTPPARALIVGLAGGTVAALLHRTFPDMAIEAAEIDAGLVDIGRKYFGLPAAVSTRIMDGRVAAASSSSTYDVVILDAYRGAYVPFHLATVEFFEILRKRLRPGGIVAVNLLGSPGEDALAEAVGTTLLRVFPVVRRLRVAQGINTVLFASGGPIGEAVRCAGACDDPLELRALELAGKLEAFEPPAGLEPLTDDLAPVETLTHRVVLDMLFR
jgi:spermidine synthase